ncbi:ATP synthase B' chain [Candidatus Magnetoovum chiemensis]|nr:ATP synthase B' chain [Candidatus Magnetoovum chiemensis]
MLEINKFWFLVQVLNFVALIFILNTILFRPLLNLFKARELTKKDSLDKAAKMNAEKDAGMAEIKREFAYAHQKAHEEFIKLRQSGLEAQKDIIRKTHDEAVNQLYYALREISQATERAKEDLRPKYNMMTEDIKNRFIR